MGFLFEDPDVYKRSVALAERITRLTGDFSSGTYAISDQLRRALLSVSCNIAEGNGRWHKKERFHFFMSARGSAAECVPLLEISRDLDLIGEDVYMELTEEIDVICRMLTRLARGAENKRRTSKGEQ